MVETADQSLHAPISGPLRRPKGGVLCMVLGDYVRPTEKMRSRRLLQIFVEWIGGHKAGRVLCTARHRRDSEHVGGKVFS